MRWINANELETWALTLNAKVELPGVVADLIRASASDIATMRFPSGDKGQVRGFDGHLECGTAGFNVPAGLSYWEFGTNADYKSKADSDFDKRTKAVPLAGQATTTFVFVSPYTWDSSNPANKLEGWVTRAKSRSSWKDVFYIDGSMLETWLDHCPAVSAWHARETFKVRPADGIRSSEEFWQDFSGQFGPTLTEDVLLCGREEPAKLLLTDLMTAVNTIQVVADAPDEAVAFAIAAMRKADPAVRLFLESKTLVVDSLVAGRQLVSDKPLVLLLRNDATRSPGQLAEKGPLLVPLGRRQSGAANFVLDRPGGQAMGMAMQSMGLDENRALTLARGSGQSLRALARLIPGGSYEDPEWVQGGQDLLPAILAGAWDATNEMDRSVIEKVGDHAKYGEIEGRVRRFADALDPPFDLEGAIWKVRAPMDAFMCIGRLFDQAHADRLRSVMLQVFSAIEPVPDPDAVVSFARPNPTVYSDWLRDGLATTFLLIAVWGETAKVNLGGLSGQDWADNLLADIPGLSSDPRVMASLKDQLPLLAEAAPDPLLSALERMLEGNGVTVRPIFDVKEGIFYPNYSHTGLLWALETIAWDPAYFRRAVLVLAGLAAIAPEIKLGNTPANSLAEILVLWNPNTNAPWPSRLSALREICRCFPEIGWRLVKVLLPSMHGSSMPTARPRLREGGASDRPRITYRELWEHQSEVISIAIDLAGSNDTRWIDLIPKLGEFSPELRDVALGKLDGLLQGAAPDKLKRLWVKLRDEASRHARFQAAQWALKGADLEPLSGLVSKYAPEDPVSTLAPLFDDYALDVTGDMTRASEQRAKALRSLFADHGRDAIVRLAKEVRVPYLVVEAVAGAGLKTADVERLLTASFGADPQSTLTVGLSGLYRREAGDGAAQQWIEAWTKEQPPEIVADLLQSWPDELSTWTFVRRRGDPVKTAYWTRRSPRYLNGSRQLLLRATLMSLRYGRALEAIQASLNRLPELPTELIFRMLDGVIPELNASKAAADTMTTFYIQKALEALDTRDAPIEELSKIEFAFFPLLEHDNTRHLALHRLMTLSAGVYHHMLVNVFRADGEEGAEEPTEDAKSRARRSYSLLTSFSDLPGFNGVTIDQEVLRLWVDEVLDLGRSSRRSAVTENFIGRLFAHAPTDPNDQGWPHRVVRDEVERLRSDELERGLQMERYNMRGAHGRQLYEGGNQERVLADQYAAWANTAVAWPRTWSLLRATATGWTRDADREDIEAAQRKLRS